MVGRSRKIRDQKGMLTMTKEMQQIRKQKISSGSE
jgi:hypothetical protein